MQSRERQLSEQVLEAVKASILSQKYARTIISIHVSILQSCGGHLSAAIMAASVALIDAGIEVRDLVTSCTLMRTSDGSWPGRERDIGGEFNDWIFLDPTDEEIAAVDRKTRCMVTVAGRSLAY